MTKGFQRHYIRDCGPSSPVGPARNRGHDLAAGWLQVLSPSTDLPN